MTSAELRPDWVPDAVFYEIFPDRFHNGDPSNDPPGSVPWGSPPSRDNFMGGDLAGITGKLGYLSELGVSALYLTPIFAAGTNHRYDTHDYLRIDPGLGDLGAFRELVQEAHGRGMRVILDGVFNHSGDGFWAFRDLLERGRASKYRDWYFTYRLPIERDPPSYQTCGGAPYLPKFNTGHPEVRHHLLEVAVYWLEEAGVDGWRLDVPWKVPLDFWEEFRRTVKEVKPEAYLVGEVWRDGVPWLEVFDGVMNYRLRDHLLDFCVRDAMDAEDLAFECSRLMNSLESRARWMMNLMSSHDTPRLLTLCGGDTERARLALTALFALPGAPMFYYGDELGLEGGNDPDCRRAMPWEESRWNQAIFEHCRTLTRLRRESVALRRGSWEPLLELNALLAYRRSCRTDEALVVLNPRHGQRDVRVPLAGSPHGLWRDAFTGLHFRVRHGALGLEWVPGTSALVLRPAAPGEARDE